MKILVRITFAIFFYALSVGAPTASAGSERLHVFYHENVLGTSLELKIFAPTALEAVKAEAAALAEIDRTAKILSTYDPQSEVSRWLTTMGQPTPVSTELFEVLSLFDQWRERSQGALDASAEVVCRLWKSAATAGRTPTAEEIAAAVDSIRRPHWKLDPLTRTAVHLSRTPIVLNTFTKSYIVNRATEAALSAASVGAVVVNIGGDLVVRGNLTEPVQITDPQADAENSAPVARLLVRNRAVATSGNYRRGVQIGGRWYSHIVDPRTGKPVDHIISATVVAPKATDAGALATALNVLAPEEGLRLANSVSRVDYMLITKDGRRLTSKGWPALELRAPNSGKTDAALSPSAPSASTAVGTGAPGLWNPSFELVVNFELARVESQRYRRPFVAVWIEDKDKFPIRTIALWFDKARWLPDLKGWYRADRLRALAEGNDITSSVSSATRAPGKYSVKWDGNDARGQTVKAGKYTVFLEVAREHGTYQLIRQEMEFGAVPKQINFPGNPEVASASFDYHKKTDGR